MNQHPVKSPHSNRYQHLNQEGLTGVFHRRPIKILVVDEHPVVREGLAAILREPGYMQIIGQAKDIAAAASLCAEMAPDVVLCDFGSSSLECARDSRKKYRDQN